MADDKLKDNQQEPKKKGGKREGAGRPKGSLSKENQAQAEALKQFKARVRRHLGPLFNSQLSLAKGLQYLIRVDEVEKTDSKGKTYTVKEHVVVSDPDEMVEVLDELDGGAGKVKNNYYYLTVEDPDNRAIDSLIDRTFGRAAQYIDHSTKGEKLNNTTAVTFIDGSKDRS